ncbi:MAG: YigZ family protein [Candidatus Cloacimonetes bacterium]|nr:YigZ family protein [Candidatus Cloacimonadota bacterium]
MIYSIEAPAEARIKTQRSEFIAFLYPISDVSEAQELLRNHQLSYANATHNCYAYLLGFAQETQYYSDAGEPSGTAGKPILNALLRNNLSGVLAIVTRYYGGIKLGVKGLIEAYGETTTLAIQQASLIQYSLYFELDLETDYFFLDILRHKMQEYKIMELEVIYTDKVKLTLKVPEAQYLPFIEYLDAQQASGRLTYFQEVK